MTTDAVAIIGMSGRFPLGEDLQSFWDGLLSDEPLLSHVPEQRWNMHDHLGPEGTLDTAYSTVGGFTTHVDGFDHRFFGIGPREAAAMDPMQRLLLQSTWAALEDAGHAPSALSGRDIGVFMGIGNAEYASLMRSSACPVDAYRATGMALSLAANRISYFLNLHGPSHVIDTACSSSLVAIHRAVESLRSGLCEMALVGGISLMLAPELFVAFSQSGMLSRSGRCRAFDISADGYVRGEGLATLVLKPHATAQRDRDFIYASIVGSAENHGGRSHSLTAPNFRAQARVIESAWRNAGTAIEKLSFIETHGTGTPLGDPIEIAGLKLAWQNSFGALDHNHPGPLFLGAVKTRIGHLEAAAGVASVVKTVLAMHHQLLPSNLGFEQLNSQIDMAGTPFRMCDRHQAWGRAEDTKVAGISSFGFGGVNAHVVIESPLASPAQENASASPQIIVLSAKDEEGLERRAEQLLEYLFPGACARVFSAVTDALAKKYGGRLAPADLGRPFSQVGIGVEVVLDIVSSVSDLLGHPLAWNSVRDCTTPCELIQNISRNLPEQPRPTHRITARASLPREVIRPTLADLAFTLGLGRDPMPERWLAVCSTAAELGLALSRFLLNETAHVSTRGHCSQPRARQAADLSDPPARNAGTEELWNWIRPLADSPALGSALERFFEAQDARRVPLPTYPFRTDRVWFQTPAQTGEVPPTQSVSERASVQFSAALLRAGWADEMSSPIDRLPSLLPLPLLSGSNESRSVDLVDVRWASPTVFPRDGTFHAEYVELDRTVVECALAGHARRDVVFQATLQEGAAAPEAGERVSAMRADFDLDMQAFASSQIWCPTELIERARRGTQCLELDFIPDAFASIDWRSAHRLAAVLCRSLPLTCGIELGPHRLLLPYRARHLYWRNGAGSLLGARVAFDAVQKTFDVLCHRKDGTALLIEALEVRSVVWSDTTDDRSLFRDAELV